MAWYADYMHVMRLIGLGRKSVGDIAEFDYPTHGSYPAFSAGELNMAPMGIGELASSGYIADMRVYYCPSSDGMPRSMNRQSHWPSGGYRVGHWPEAGGFEASNLLYGDWQSQNHHRTSGGSPSFSAMAVESHYAYRNIPWAMQGGGHYDHDLTFGRTLLGTAPRVQIQQGRPLFRTQRVLGSRAIVTDAFDKGHGRGWDALGQDKYAIANGQAVEVSMVLAGMGIKGHMEGYNVLYGDGRVAWYADPQQQLIWHTEGCSYGSGTASTPNGRYWGAGQNHLAANYWRWMRQERRRGFNWRDGTDTTDDLDFRHSNLAIWHRMDNAAGIDVGADAPE